MLEVTVDAIGYAGMLLMVLGAAILVRDFISARKRGKSE